MAHPQIAVFARAANGDAKPVRSIAGQSSYITRTIHDMAYNPVTDEIVIPQFHADAIMTYRGGADGDEAPIRVIQGPSTQINTPARLGLDPIHKEVFLPLGDQILVFPSDAKGDVAPIRKIKGPNTQLGADALTIDPIHNLLIVSGGRPRSRTERAAGARDGAETPEPSNAPGTGDEGGGGGRGQILIFNRTDNGDVKPLREIFGPKSKIGRTGLITNYPPKEEIVLGVPSADKSSPNNFVGVWSEHDTGDVPPRWMIGGPNQALRQVRGIILVPHKKEIIVGDKYQNSVFTYYFPEIF